MTGPLTGLKVVDLTSMMAGPYCTRLMADLGADVIKVEAVDGDHMRRLKPRRNGASRFFGQLNAGKRSVALDLRSPAGVRAALRLAESADVLLESWRPGVADRLGLGYKACHALAPRLVYCSISGYGQSGPDAGRAAFAPNIHATSGFDVANSAYQHGSAEPPVTGIFIGDILGGTLAFGAVLAGLRERDTTGNGPHIDVSLMDAMVSTLVYEVQNAVAGSTEARPTHRPIPASDGHFVLTIVNDHNWAGVARAIGRPELAGDPRFHNLRARTEHWDEIHELVCAWAANRSAAEAEREMLANGVPAARYRSPADLLADPHLLARDHFRRATDHGGEFHVPATPFRFDDTASPAHGTTVPALGADTHTVLRDAGLSEEDIDRMLADGTAKSAG